MLLSTAEYQDLNRLAFCKHRKTAESFFACSVQTDIFIYTEFQCLSAF